MNEQERRVLKECLNGLEKAGANMIVANAEIEAALADIRAAFEDYNANLQRLINELDE
jgi:hypothetical protein